MRSRCDFCVFFFKQKTAYEMRISDWSSDVCSSDLLLKAVTLPDRCGGLRNGALLGSHARRDGTRGAPDPAILCEGLCQARQKRRTRCRSDLRGRAAPNDAVRAGQDDRATSHSHDPRSEEHTSELQSLMRISYAVFCLKKKTKQNK